MPMEAQPETVLSKTRHSSHQKPEFTLVQILSREDMWEYDSLRIATETLDLCEVQVKGNKRVPNRIDLS